MAEVYSVTAAGVGVSTTAKTVIEINAGSAAAGRLVGVDISFNSSSAGAGVVVELIRFTTTGTGTAYTPMKYNGDAQRKAALLTAKVNDSVEPTGVTIGPGFYVPNTSGQITQLPLGRECDIPPSTGIGIRVTAPASVNCYCNAYFEE